MKPGHDPADLGPIETRFLPGGGFSDLHFNAVNIQLGDSNLAGQEMERLPAQKNRLSPDFSIRLGNAKAIEPDAFHELAMDPADFDS